jgi:hypothetical protein
VDGSMENDPYVLPLVYMRGIHKNSIFKKTVSSL